MWKFGCPKIIEVRNTDDWLVFKLHAGIDKSICKKGWKVYGHSVRHMISNLIEIQPHPCYSIVRLWEARLRAHYSFYKVYTCSCIMASLWRLFMYNNKAVWLNYQLVDLWYFSTIMLIIHIHAQSFDIAILYMYSLLAYIYLLQYFPKIDIKFYSSLYHSTIIYCGTYHTHEHFKDYSPHCPICPALF